MTLENKAIFITGATRGIGREIALRCARDGANIIVTGKSDEPHPKLPGTIHSVADEVREAGGNALAIKLDVRDDKSIEEAMQNAASEFGGIDALINNASAISLTPCEATKMSRFDLMFGVNVRATFAASRAALPFLKAAKNPHILTLSPPLNMDPKWFKDHVAYTMSKYGMSMCTLGLAEEWREAGIGVNSLWPKTTIATAAIQYNFPPELMAASRKPAIMADAAIHVLTQACRELTGQFLIDEDVLRSAGVSDFDQYAVQPGVPLYPDLFL